MSFTHVLKHCPIRLQYRLDSMLWLPFAVLYKKKCTHNFFDCKTMSLFFICISLNFERPLKRKKKVASTCTIFFNLWSELGVFLLFVFFFAINLKIIWRRPGDVVNNWKFISKFGERFLIKYFVTSDVNKWWETTDKLKMVCVYLFVIELLKLKMYIVLLYILFEEE